MTTRSKYPGGWRAIPVALPELLHSAELSLTKETLKGVSWHGYVTRRWNSVSWSQHWETHQSRLRGEETLCHITEMDLLSHVAPLTNVTLAKPEDVLMVREKSSEEETLKAGLGLSSTVSASHAWGPRFNPQSDQKEKYVDKKKRKLRRGERWKQKQ